MNPEGTDVVLEPGQTVASHGMCVVALCSHVRYHAPRSSTVHSLHFQTQATGFVYEVRQVSAPPALPKDSNAMHRNRFGGGVGVTSTGAQG